jgi:hypothetical protein
MGLVSGKHRVPREGELNSTSGPDQDEIAISDLGEKNGIRNDKHCKEGSPIPGEYLLRCFRSSSIRERILPVYIL